MYELRSIIMQSQSIPRVKSLWITIYLSGALLAISLIFILVDPRSLNDISVWVKPIKFNVSFGLHLLTIIWMLSYIDPEVLRRKSSGVIVGAMSIAVALEVSYITLQAARGRPSHFNFETLIERLGYQVVMGVSVLIIVLLTFYIGVLLLRKPKPGVNVGIRWGGAIGLCLGSVLTLVVAGYLSSRSAHWVSGIPSDEGGLPIVGWSRTGGDLRVTHFFATHLMQFLPLVGLLLDKLNRNGRLGTIFIITLITLLSLVSVVIVYLTFIQALRGEALIGL